MITMFNHQIIALEHMRKHNSFALFMGQGCGKTIPAIFRILELLKEKKIDDALVIAPKTVLGSWHRDIEKLNAQERSLLLDAITFINYDLAWRREELNKPWGIIILDESHYIKNRTSNRAKFILKLSIKSKYRYILTGTPISNGKLEDIWSQFAFLEPELIHGRISCKALGTYTEFLNRYCILNQYFSPSGYIRVDELQRIISKYSYRVTKEQCLDLPEKLPDEIYEIELKEPQKYKELMKYSTVEELDILAENPLARMLKLRQLSSGFLTLEDSIMDFKCDKLKVLNEFLENHHRKLVIFAQFTHSIDMICSLLQKRKLNYIVLDGRQKDKFIWREFQNNQKIKVIVCQYESASTGIDLYSADMMIYYEPTIRSTTLEQSRDRIHRNGQTQRCSYIHFLTKGTIEEKIYKTLQGYGDFGERIFNEYMKEYTRSYDRGKRK